MKTSLLLSWIAAVTGSGLNKLGEQIMMMAMALLLMTMETAMLPVIMKEVLLLELLP